MNIKGGNQTIGLVLVVIGAIVLLGRFVAIDFAWPLFILLPGLLLLGLATLGKMPALMIPGSIITTVGLILFVQSATDYFQSWAYAWALIPTAVGLGLWWQGDQAGDSKQRAEGRRTAGIGLSLFVAFAVFFELIIYNNVLGGLLGSIALPLLLIAGGAFLLLRQNRQKTPPASPNEESASEGSP